jgi:hypothetical protein
MRHLVLPLLSVILAGLMTWASAAGTKVVFEAESYSSITPSMAKAVGSMVSGGAYIHVPLLRPHGVEEGAPTDQGRATYRIKIPVAGTYRFWALCNWHDGCGNSFFLKIDDKPAVVLGQDGTYQRWHWVKGPTLHLGAGLHTVIVQYREDGAKLDQAMFTTDTRYVPVRAERATPQYIVR